MEEVDMFSIDFKVDNRRVENALSQLASDLQDKAIMRAVNKTADAAKTATSREIRAQGYNIKAAAISKSLHIRRATRHDLEAVIEVTGKPIPLINYGARQVGRGVSVQVKNGRKIIPGAFIATMPNGHRGVFVRVGKGHKKVMRGGRAVWSGLPIRELWGPSIPTAAANEAVQSALASTIRDKYARLLAHEIRFILLSANR
jgi:hypothetical protein